MIGTERHFEGLKQERDKIYAEIERIRGSDGSKLRVKNLNVRVNELNRLIGMEKKLIHMELNRNHSHMLVKAMKKYVTKEDFDNAVNDAVVMQENYEREYEQERRRVFGACTVDAPRKDPTATMAIGSVYRKYGN